MWAGAGGEDEAQKVRKLGFQNPGILGSCCFEVQLSLPRLYTEA